MTDRSPLVDKGAKTTPLEHAEQYVPFKRGADGNIESTTPVPFITYGPGGTPERPKIASGIPVAGSLELFAFDLAKGDYFSTFFDGLAVLADSAAVGASVADLDSWGDLVSFLTQPLIAWIMDHVQPVRLLVDLLAGNPGTITGVAKTWTNMGEALGTAASGLYTSAGATQDYWQGPASDAYRAPYAHDLVEATNGLGILYEVWAVVLQITSDLVLVAHNLVRDLVSTLIATLLQFAVDALAYPFPANVAILAKDGLFEIAKMSAWIAKAIALTAKGLIKGTAVAAHLLTLARTIATTITYLIELARRGGNAAPAA